jgi:glycosyltransferase involved in cell wall biosynthesis
LGHELPTVLDGATEAKHFRAQQIVKPLLDDGHEVLLCASADVDNAAPDRAIHPGLHYQRVNFRRSSWLGRVRRLARAFQPQALIGVMFASGLRAARLGLDVPFWADIYGDRMAEMQLATWASGVSRGHLTQLGYNRILLRRADVFSTCGIRQAYALVGQLAMLGRLNRQTFGYEFVYPILPGAFALSKGRPIELNGTVRKSPDDFVVLWCGGYNVWTDVDTLFGGLEQAMNADARVRFVSLGGAVRMGGNDTYDRFQRMVANSPHRDRYTLLGWRPAAELPAYYRESDVGINIDALHYEAVLGTRTRLAEMIAHELPVITTLCCELSGFVEEQGAGLTVPVGDGTALGARIVSLARDPELKTRLATGARRLSAGELSAAQTARPLRRWANAPWAAPDRLSAGRESRLRRLEFRLRALARLALWRAAGLEPGD